MRHLAVFFIKETALLNHTDIQSVLLVLMLAVWLICILWYFSQQIFIFKAAKKKMPQSLLTGSLLRKRPRVSMGLPQWDINKG